MKRLKKVPYAGLVSIFILCAFLSLSVHVLLTLAFVLLASYFLMEVKG